MERIDVSGPPDGTVVETNLGHLYHTDRGGFQNARRDIGDGNPLAWNADHYPVRAYEPLPTPDQEVPRDQWDAIPVGTPVRIETAYGVTLVGPWLRDRDNVAVVGGTTPTNKSNGVHSGDVIHLYRLDEPAPSPADVIGARQVQALTDAGWQITRAES